MNKKFSTLVAGLLLASAVSVQADVYPIASFTGTNQATIGAVTDASAGEGYQVGKAYLLGESQNGKVLSVEEDEDIAGKFTLVYKNQPTQGYQNVQELHKAMWQLQDIVAQAGAVAPKYVFVNMFT